MEQRYSENPREDVWRLLLHYTYPVNVRRQLGNSADEALVYQIANAVTQSREYFAASESVSLNTSPVLLYYGVVNLLFAATLLLTKQSASLKSHGASVEAPTAGGAIGDSSVFLSSASTGAFMAFTRVFPPDGTAGKVRWSLRDILSFIPDVRNEFESCYDGHFHACIPLQIVRRKNDTVDRIRLADVGARELPVASIREYGKAYIAPQRTAEYYVLRRRIDYKDASIASLSGQRHLVVCQGENGKLVFLNEVVGYFLALFSLSVLSRYHPNVWYPFVNGETTGERNLILGLLLSAGRKMPNLILNSIQGKEIVFTYEKQGQLDISKDYDPDDVKRLIREETSGQGRL